MQLLRVSVLPVLFAVGFCYFPHSRKYLDIKLIYEAPDAEDKSRPVPSSAEVVATAMALS